MSKWLNFRWFAGLCAFCLSFAQSASGQQVFEFDFQGETVAVEGEGARGATLAYDWSAQTKVGRLMGEPVISTRFRFDLADGRNLLDGRITLPSSTAETGTRYEWHLISNLPQEAQDRIALYDVKLRINFDSALGDFYLISDVGLPGKPGAWSFNVAGSPDWDEMFIDGSAPPDTPTYISAERAKTEVKDGLHASSAQIIEAHLSLFDLHAWYDRMNPDHSIEVLRKAIAPLQDGLRISYGFVDPAARFTPDVFDLGLDGKLETLEYYQKRYEKLQNVPDRFRIGDNHQPYRQAQRMAREILQAGNLSKPGFENTQTELPGGRAQGAEALFFAGYEIRLDPKDDDVSYIVEKGTGTVLRQWHKWDPPLVFGQFVMDVAHCRNGQALVGMADPSDRYAREILQTFQVACPSHAYALWADDRVDARQDEHATLIAGIFEFRGESTRPLSSIRDCDYDVYGTELTVNKAGDVISSRERGFLFSHSFEKPKGGCVKPYLDRTRE